MGNLTLISKEHSMNSLQCMMCQSSSYEYGKEKLKVIPFLRFHLLYLMRRVLVVPLLAVDAHLVVLLLLPAVRRLDVQAAMLRLLLPPAVVDVREAEQAIKVPAAGATAELHAQPTALRAVASLCFSSGPMEFSFSSGPSTTGKDLKRPGYRTGLAEMNVVLWADPCFVQAKIFRPIEPPSGPEWRNRTRLAGNPSGSCYPNFSSF
jgi:hypothetical protein